MPLPGSTDRLTVKKQNIDSAFLYRQSVRRGGASRPPIREQAKCKVGLRSVPLHQIGGGGRLCVVANRKTDSPRIFPLRLFPKGRDAPIGTDRLSVKTQGSVPAFLECRFVRQGGQGVPKREA